jgi:hypothetical protein
MIIKCNIKERQVGQIIDGLINDHEGETHKCRFQILQELTKDDYIKWCIIEDRKVGIILSNDRFFRISID